MSRSKHTSPIFIGFSNLAQSPAQPSSSKINMLLQGLVYTLNSYEHISQPSLTLVEGGQDITEATRIMVDAVDLAIGKGGKQIGWLW